MTSLQKRLHIGLIGSLTLITILLWWLATLALSHFSEAMMLSRLQHDSEALLASLRPTAEQQLDIKESNVGHIYEQIFSGHYYVIQTQNGTLRSRSLWDSQLTLQPQQPGESQLYYENGPNKQPLLIWAAGFQRHNQTITIAVAEDTTAINQQLEQLTLFFLIGGGVILFILIVMQRYVVRSSLRSIEAIKQELEKLAQGESTTLPTEVPKEILPLVEEVNRLLVLINQRLLRSRNAMGNLAHSLKHPLSLLIQLAEREELEKHPAIHQELRKQSNAIKHLMERELKRARLAGSGLPGQHFRPADELPPLLDVLGRVYHDKAINYQLTCPTDIDYPADRHDMLELLGNILDNAYKWASSKVVCTILQEQTGLLITVEDDGPGCSEEQQQQLTQRGVRIDESTQGHGLGLAIAHDVVTLYHGELRFQNAEQLSGLKVCITLPLPERHIDNSQKSA